MCSSSYSSPPAAKVPPPPPVAPNPFQLIPVIDTGTRPGEVNAQIATYRALAALQLPQSFKQMKDRPNFGSGNNGGSPNNPAHIPLPYK